MHIIFESVLMQLTENYQNWSVLVEATACQICRVFSETRCILNKLILNILICAFLCGLQHQACHMAIRLRRFTALLKSLL